MDVFGPGRYYYGTFLLLGNSVRPTHNLEVSVGDRKSLLVDARPHLALGEGVWVFALLFHGVRGLRVYCT